MKQPTTIVISGASRGIGAALARYYARHGVTLGLFGRNKERLEETATACELKGAVVKTASVDTRSRQDMETLLTEFDREFPVDLVIANAGVNRGAKAVGDIEPANASHEVMVTNVLGTINTIHPLIDRMVERGRGQIALMSSLAAYSALPENPSYCASKALLLTYGTALRYSLKKYGVSVSVVCPGYVATQMEAQLSGWKPFRMTAEEAAERIGRGLAYDRPVIAFPALLAWLSRIGAILPEQVRQFASRPFRSGFGDAP